MRLAWIEARRESHVCVCDSGEQDDLKACFAGDSPGGAGLQLWPVGRVTETASHGGGVCGPLCGSGLAASLF